MKTGIEFFQYFTFLFINISILSKHILKNCKLRSVFPNCLNLYIFGVRATEILIRFTLCFVLFNFLCSHFITVSEPKINLNFHKYNTITRIDGSSNIITFYAYCFGNYVTLRKDFDQNNRVVLHTKIDLNLHLVKRPYRAANFFNVFATETYWINLVAIGLFMAKVSLKHNINFFIHIFCIQLLHYTGTKKDLATTVK